eukprot:15440149-Alexandrium_andersonii.AAC.1
MRAKTRLVFTYLPAETGPLNSPMRLPDFRNANCLEASCTSDARHSKIGGHISPPMAACPGSGSGPAASSRRSAWSL